MATDTTMQKCETTACTPERVHGGRTYIPAVDIVEMPEELLLLADMPGVKAADLSVNYERGLLTLHGRVTPRQDASTTDFLLGEYGVGDFMRSFQIGEGVDSARIQAELKDGVLTLHLPKKQEVLPRKIAVKTA